MADTITLLLLLLPSIPISGIECLKEETVKIAMLVTARLFVNRWLGKRVVVGTPQVYKTGRWPHIRQHLVMAPWDFSRDIRRSCLGLRSNDGVCAQSMTMGVLPHHMEVDRRFQLGWLNRSDTSHGLLLLRRRFLFVVDILWLALSRWCKQISITPDIFAPVGSYNVGLRDLLGLDHMSRQINIVIKFHRI